MSAPTIREIAADDETLWKVARLAIEDELVEWRDAGLSVGRNNGLVIKSRAGEPSSIIRFGPEHAIRVALLALADHYDQAGA